jgi:type I restriction enzyme S subunit
MSHNNSFFKLIHFRDVTQWFVGYYLNDIGISSSYHLIPLREIISPKRILIKKEDYDGVTPIVEKIVFKTGHIVFREVRKTGMNLCALKQNDLLVSSINFHQGATALNTFGDIVASTHYQSYLIRTEVVIPEYLTMVMRSPFFLSIVSGKKANGIKNESGYSFIGSFKIPVPTLIEQKAIIGAYEGSIRNAELLEQKANSLEEYIDKYIQTELYIKQIDNIEILKDKDQYLSYVRYNDMIEWGYDRIKKKGFGISQKYPSKQIKDICSLGSGGTPSRSNPSYYQGDIPWVKTGEVVNDVIFNTEEHINQNAIENSSAKLYPKGSLIIAMYGQGDTRGRTAKLGINASTNQACAVLYNIDNNVVSTDFLWYYLQARYNDLRSLASGNNQPNLNAGKIKTFDVVIPSLEIQNRIVQTITEQKERIKLLKHQAEILRKKAIDEFEKAIFD